MTYEQQVFRLDVGDISQAIDHLRNTYPIEKPLNDADRAFACNVVTINIHKLQTIRSQWMAKMKLGNIEAQDLDIGDRVLVMDEKTGLASEATVAGRAIVKDIELMNEEAQLVRIMFEFELTGRAKWQDHKLTDSFRIVLE